jgi:predicted kinase
MNDTKIKIIAISGLPGSGKTFYAENLLKKLPGAVLFDDVKIEDIDKIKEASKKYNPIILTDPWFSDAACRRRAEGKLKEVLGDDVVIDWVFFEHDLEQCTRNVELRADGREVNGSLRRFNKVYSIPDGSVVLPVWKPEQ